jgi:hypothetical protein
VTSRRHRADEGGFALILAILALMLLTFLGMTLAATTSTELLISNNYRWGQQALYNAEAGLEVARAVLAQVGDGQLVLPPARTDTWDPDDWTPPIPPSVGPTWSFSNPRNGENGFCDRWQRGTGYGQVLVDPNNPGLPLNDVNTVFGDPNLRLSGTFTVWVRREPAFIGAGIGDNPSGETFIVTAEGTAPFAFDGAFQRSNRAVRRLESTVSVREGCRPSNAQASSTGFSDCEIL